MKTYNKEKLNLVIFRNNLRVQDNYSLYYALQKAKQTEKLVCIYSLQILEGEYLGFKKCGKFRKEFILESILELKESLEEMNIAFYLVKDIKVTLETLNKSWSLELFFEEEVGVEEKSLEKIFKRYAYNSYFSQTLLESFEIDITKVLVTLEIELKKL